MSVGEKIKVYISEKGITQRFLAESANVADSTMSRILRGQQEIGLIEYHDVCKALGLPMSYFFEEV